MVLPSRKPYPPAGDLWISDTRAVDSSVALEREVVTAGGMWLPFLVIGLSLRSERGHWCSWRNWALVLNIIQPHFCLGCDAILTHQVLAPLGRNCDHGESRLLPVLSAGVLDKGEPCPNADE